MNILMVCREVPYPPNAGYKIRTFNLIKHLSSVNSITLVCYDTGDNSEDNTAGISSYCDKIQLVTLHTNSKIRKLFKIIICILAGQPISVVYVKSNAMKTALSDIVSTGNFDFIHFDDPYIASNWNFTGDVIIKKSVTFHDIDSCKFRRIYKIETSIRKKAMLLLDSLLVNRWERNLVKKTDMSIVMSDLDANTLKANGHESTIFVIPNGVDTQRFEFSDVSRIHDTISFFGTLDYSPNQDAVFYFYQQILPLIKLNKPETKFVVVGRNPSKKLNNLARDSCIILAENVADVIPYYLQSSVAVVPLRAGGGTRLKILEAMALGCPVVSTSIGSEGLNVTHDENIMLADCPEKFAKITVELMTNEALRKKLTVAARHFVERWYSWDQIAASMCKTYQEMVER